MAPVKREQFDIEREPFDALFSAQMQLQQTFLPSPFTTLMRPSFCFPRNIGEDRLMLEAFRHRRLAAEDLSQWRRPSPETVALSMNAITSETADCRPPSHSGARYRRHIGFELRRWEPPGPADLDRVMATNTSILKKIRK